MGTLLGCVTGNPVFPASSWLIRLREAYSLLSGG